MSFIPVTPSIHSPVLWCHMIRRKAVDAFIFSRFFHGIQSSKEQKFLEIEIVNIKHIFTVHFNASIINKSIIFFKKNLTVYIFITLKCYYFVSIMSI